MSTHQKNDGEPPDHAVLVIQALLEQCNSARKGITEVKELLAGTQQQVGEALEMFKRTNEYIKSLERRIEDLEKHRR